MYNSDECTCHINPPCGFCTSRVRCVICNEQVREDEARYGKKAADDEYGPFCENCIEKED